MNGLLQILTVGTLAGAVVWSMRLWLPAAAEISTLALTLMVAGGIGLVSAVIDLLWRDPAPKAQPKKTAPSASETPDPDLITPPASEATDEHLMSPAIPSLFSLLGAPVTPMIGRERVLAGLVTWAATDESLQMRFVVGESGVGKSRLANEVGGKLAEQGWHVITADLNQTSTLPGDNSDLPPDLAPATLLIVDHPEEAPDQVVDLLDRLNQQTETRVHPLRVLLLTRPMPSWDRRAALGHLRPVLDREIHLNPLEPGPARQLFHATRSALFERVGVSLHDDGPPGEDSIDQWLTTDPLHRRPVLLCAAALHHLVSAGTPLPNGAVLLDHLSTRERTRLSTIGFAHHLDGDGLSCLLAMANLSGNDTGQDIAGLRLWGQQKALALWPDHPSIERPDDDLLTEPLQSAMRQTDLLVDGLLSRREPNLLAAWFSLSTLNKTPNLAPERIWAAVVADPERALTAVGRMQYDLGQGMGGTATGRNEDDPLAEEAPALTPMQERADSMASLPVEWLLSALRDPETDDKVSRCKALASICAQPHLPQTLVPVAVEVWGTLAVNAPSDEARARALGHMELALGRLGDREGALGAATEAVAVRKQLATQQPERFLPELATSLNNLGAMLSAVGDKQGALEAARQAVETYEKLAETEPTAFVPGVAAAHNNLANRLADSGDPEGALAATREAVSVLLPAFENYPAALAQWMATITRNHVTKAKAAGTTMDEELMARTRAVFESLSGQSSDQTRSLEDDTTRPSVDPAPESHEAVTESGTAQESNATDADDSAEVSAADATAAIGTTDTVAEPDTTAEADALNAPEQLQEAVATTDESAPEVADQPNEDPAATPEEMLAAAADATATDDEVVRLVDEITEPAHDVATANDEADETSPENDSLPDSPADEPSAPMAHTDEELVVDQPLADPVNGSADAAQDEEGEAHDSQLTSAEARLARIKPLRSGDSGFGTAAFGVRDTAGSQKSD